MIITRQDDIAQETLPEVMAKGANADGEVVLRLLNREWFIFHGPGLVINQPPLQNIFPRFSPT